MSPTKIKPRRPRLYTRSFLISPRPRPTQQDGLEIEVAVETILHFGKVTVRILGEFKCL
jgi:hypothetical protein